MRKQITHLITVVMLFLATNIASGQLPGSNQTALVPSAVPQFVDPLPHFSGLRLDAKAGGHLIIKAVPHQQIAVSTGTQLANGVVGPANPNVGMANFWTYSISKDGGNTWSPPNWPAFTIEAQRGNPLDVTFRNELHGQSYADVNLTQDQSIMWASPTVTGNILNDPYSGPVPVCVHLHGAEVASTSDGGPNSWFTPGYNLKGSSFQQGVDSVYHYTNTQEAATLWYHDHTMGATRLNVYSGLAGFYFLRGNDEETDHLPGWSGDDLVKEVAPAGTTGTFNPEAYLPEIEIAIQDREFDTYGGLFWPVEPPNPEIHPFWSPESFGSIMTVNGKTWPYLSVAPRKYRFHFLDGCNASFLNMSLRDPSGNPGPALTQITTDGGLMDSPVVFDPTEGKSLLLAPGERAEIVIDFSTVAPGSVWTLVTDARRPYPMGDLPDPLYNGRIMQFVVNGQMVSSLNPNDPGTDKSQVPAILRSTPLIKLTDFAGNLNVTPAVKRQLTLNEAEGEGGPEMVLINNSRFDDMQGPGQFGEVTEKPVEGTSEIWQIINTTMDAHPIHMHLVQFQLVSRQNFDHSQYEEAYNEGFPGSSWIAGGGPPNAYNYPNADGALGGNPPTSGYVSGSVMYPEPNERGWKDTYICYPNQLTTFIVRFCPTDLPVTAAPGSLLFPFDPGTGPGYVWHCHIVDHEDNEMMRPYTVVPSPYRVTGLPVALNTSGYNLEQNQPNPTSADATINFTIPEAEHVNLTLYSNTGDEIHTLMDAHLPAGSHDVIFDGAGLPDGIYYYRLRAGNYSEVKKLVIAK